MRRKVQKNLSTSDYRRALEFTTHYSEVLKNHWFIEEEGKFFHISLITAGPSQGWYSLFEIQNQTKSLALHSFMKFTGGIMWHRMD